MTFNVQVNFILEKEKIASDISDVTQARLIREQINDNINILFYNLEQLKIPPYCCKVSINCED